MLISLPMLFLHCRFSKILCLYKCLLSLFYIRKAVYHPVGPVIDLYGHFAAEKLGRLMELYPDRVYSKPEFTALPPYLFSGADFALIPSRDELLGLVAVEFRKGALGVDSRLCGLGLMPGWVRRTVVLFCIP